jgi:hypothetical protein
MPAGVGVRRAARSMYGDGLRLISWMEGGPGVGMASPSESEEVDRFNDLGHGHGGPHTQRSGACKAKGPSCSTITLGGCLIGFVGFYPGSRGSNRVGSRIAVNV